VKRRYLFFGLLVISIALVVASLVRGRDEIDSAEPYEVELGASFSPAYAESLGLDPKEAYRAILDEFGFRSVRLPVYWDAVEQEDDRFDYSELEWYIEEAGGRGMGVVLVLGYRNFRYPECYPPDWVQGLNNRDFEGELMEFLTEVITHFTGGEHSRTIEAWQVENEPFDLPFYRRWCRHFSADLIRREIETVRANDPAHRPIILTFGGEVFLRGLWRKVIERADVFGVSFYPRTVLPGGLVVETYRLGLLSPRNIAKERAFAESLGKDFWVVEMQAERWGEEPETMSPELLKENYDLLFSFGGAGRIYFWGVEWWYKELLEGRSGMWDAAKELINY